MEPEEISLDIAVGQIQRFPVLVETEQGRAIITRSDSNPGTTTVEAHLEDGRDLSLRKVPLERPLRQVAASLTSSRPMRAFSLGNYMVRSKTKPVQAVLQNLPLLLAVIAGPVVMTPIDDALSWFLRGLIILIGVTAGVFWYDSHQKAMTYRKWVLWELGRKEEHQLREIELPPLVEEADVDDVKVEYGTLLSNIIYRIENPALFDPHEPTTKQFTLALLQWDNNEGLMTKEEMRELADRVRSTFQAAKANAERVGMTHLPPEAEPRAATALKAARLATDESATEGERENALRQAVAILDELALYYLPSGAETRKAITGSAPLQLPGRRSQ